MTRPTGLRIIAIHNQTAGSKDLEDEYVTILNDGPQTWGLSGWLVTDETDQQLRPHIYRFPQKLTGGSGWSFEPGEAIFVITGPGDDKFIAEPGTGKRPQFHFHWNRTSFVWNNSGDRVYLRHPDGTFASERSPFLRNGLLPMRRTQLAWREASTRPTGAAAENLDDFGPIA